MPSATVQQVRAALVALANPAKAQALQRFFKTGPGEYAEGDRFLGVMVPQQRQVARQFDTLPVTQIQRLLRSEIHEERLVALLILVHRFEHGDRATRQRLFHLYLKNTRWVNNWDLVDLSAPRIVGVWLVDKKRHWLYRLAKSPSLWERRIALLAALAFIRLGDFRDTLALAAQLLDDPEDLIHKAAGWMLREVGKRDANTLETFLKQYGTKMPRTMLRYAIERFGPAKRLRFLRGTRTRPIEFQVPIDNPLRPK